MCRARPQRTQLKVLARISGRNFCTSLKFKSWQIRGAHWTPKAFYWNPKGPCLTSKPRIKDYQKHPRDRLNSRMQLQNTGESTWRQVRRNYSNIGRKLLKKMNSLGDLWNNIKSSNTCVVGIPKIEEKQYIKDQWSRTPHIWWDTWTHRSKFKRESIAALPSRSCTFFFPEVYVQM